MIRFKHPLSSFYWWKHILIGYTFLICLLSVPPYKRDEIESNNITLFSYINVGFSFFSFFFRPPSSSSSSSLLYVNAVPIAYWYKRSGIPICPIPPGIPYQQAYPIHMYTFSYNRTEDPPTKNTTTTVTRRRVSDATSTPSSSNLPIYPPTDLSLDLNPFDNNSTDISESISTQIRNLMNDVIKNKEEKQKLILHKVLYPAAAATTDSSSLSSSSSFFRSSSSFSSSLAKDDEDKYTLLPYRTLQESTGLTDTTDLETDLISVGFSYCTTLDPWGGIIPLPQCNSMNNKGNTVLPSLTIARSTDAGRNWDCNYAIAPSSALRIGASTVSGFFQDPATPACSLMCILGGWFLINGNPESITRSVLCSNDGGITWLESTPLPTTLVWATAVQLSAVAILVVGGIREDAFSPDAALIGVVDSEQCLVATWIDIPTPPDFGSRITPLVNSQVSGRFIYTQRVLIGGGIAVPTITSFNAIQTWSTILWSTINQKTVITNPVNPFRTYLNTTLLPWLDSSSLNLVPLVDTYVCDPCDRFDQFLKVNSSLPVDGISPVSVILSWGGSTLQNTSIGNACYKVNDPVFRCLVYVAGQRIFISTAESGAPRWSPFDLVMDAGFVSRTPRTPVPTGWLLNHPKVIESRFTIPMIVAVAYTENTLTVGVPVPCAPSCGDNEYIGGCPFGPESGYCSTCSSCKLGNTYEETPCINGIQSIGGYGGDTVCSICTPCEDNTIPYRSCNLTMNTQCPIVNPLLICKASTVLQTGTTDLSTSTNILPPRVASGTSPAFVSAIFVFLSLWVFAFLLPTVIYERAIIITKPWIIVSNPYLRTFLYLVQKVYTLIVRDITFMISWFTIIVDNWLITVLFSISEPCTYYFLNTNIYTVNTVYTISFLILLWMLCNLIIGLVYRYFEVRYYNSTPNEITYTVAKRKSDSSSFFYSYFCRCGRHSASLPFEKNSSMLSREVSCNPLPILRQFSTYLHPRTLWNHAGSTFIWISSSSLPTETHLSPYNILGTLATSSTLSTPSIASTTVSGTINYRYLFFGFLILLYDLANTIIVGLGIVVMKTSTSLSFRMSNSLIHAQNAQVIILDCLILGFALHFIGIMATMVRLFDYIQNYQQKHNRWAKDQQSMLVYPHNNKQDDTENRVSLQMNILRHSYHPTTIDLPTSTGLVVNYPGVSYDIHPSLPTGISTNNILAKVDNNTLSSLLAREDRTQHLAHPSPAMTTTTTTSTVNTVARIEVYPTGNGTLSTVTGSLPVQEDCNGNNNPSIISSNHLNSEKDNNTNNISTLTNNTLLASVLASSLKERPPGTVVAPIVNSTTTNANNNNTTTTSLLSPSSQSFRYQPNFDNNSSNNYNSNTPDIYPSTDHHMSPEGPVHTASSSLYRFPSSHTLTTTTSEPSPPILPNSTITTTMNNSNSTVTTTALPTSTTTTTLANMSRDHIETLRRVVLHLANQGLGSSSSSSSSDDGEDRSFTTSCDYPPHENRSRRSNSTDEPSSGI